MLRVKVSYLRQLRLCKEIDGRSRVPEQDGGVGRDDELRIALNEAVHRGQEGQLAGRRQRGLWLVKEIQSVAAEPMQHERQKGLPVRLCMQAAAAVLIGIPGVHRRRHIVEGLGSQEIRVRGRVSALGEDQRAEEA